MKKRNNRRVVPSIQSLSTRYQAILIDHCFSCKNLNIKERNYRAYDMNDYKGPHVNYRRKIVGDKMREPHG